MNVFWRYAKQMLAYRQLLVIAMAAAVVDAACAFGGFAALMWVISQLFGANRTVHQIVLEKLTDEKTVAWIGDQSHLAQYIPADRFWGFACILGIIFVLAIIGSMMRFIHQSCIITVALRTIMRVRKNAFQRLIHAPLELIMTIGTADNLSRIVRDTAQLGRGFNALMGKAVRDVLIGSAMLLLAVLIDPWLACIFLLGVPLIAICIRKFGKRIRRASKRAFKAYGGMTGALQESMQAVQVVKVHNAEGYERRRFNTINRKVLKQEMRARTARALSAPVIELMAIGGVIVVSLVAGWYVFSSGVGQPQDMVQVLIALGAAGASFKPLANLNNDLQEAAAAANRIDEILALPVEPSAREQRKQNLPRLPRHCQDVRFEQVTYHYPNTQRPAIHDVSLEVKHGQSIAIVGPNGAGKSTLLTLLPRLTEPTSGKILIDGQDIASVNLRSLRKQIAVVTQQTVLFEGSIADNIAYGQRYITREALESAARAAHAHDFISELPQGYDTLLGEGGAGLSGGQKQRIAIARAILRDPAILILDEATSQIDARSEAQINEALAQFRQGRTTFIIAHRLSTVVDADLIVVMVDGQIASTGKHHELLETCPTYQTLTRTQLQPAS